MNILNFCLYFLFSVRSSFEFLHFLYVFIIFSYRFQLRSRNQSLHFPLFRILNTQRIDFDSRKLEWKLSNLYKAQTLNSQFWMDIVFSLVHCEFIGFLLVQDKWLNDHFYAIDFQNIQKQNSGICIQYFNIFYYQAADGCFNSRMSSSFNKTKMERTKKFCFLSLCLFQFLKWLSEYRNYVII